MNKANDFKAQANNRPREKEGRTTGKNKMETVAEIKRLAAVADKKKVLQILKDVQEDENFKDFYAGFETLRAQAEDQEILQSIKPENDNGNTEYKLKFDHPTLNRVDHLTGQMIFRLNEGFGTAIYKIGVMDNGEVYGISLSEVQ